MPFAKRVFEPYYKKKTREQNDLNQQTTRKSNVLPGGNQQRTLPSEEAAGPVATATTNGTASPAGRNSRTPEENTECHFYFFTKFF